MRRPTLFDPTKAGPSEVVAEVWRLLEAEDYFGAANLHTTEFAAWAATEAARDANPRPRKRRTAEELLESHPDMPREVAEYEAAQYRKQPAPAPYFGDVFGVHSRSELEALSPVEILARRLQAADWRTRLRPHLEALSARHPQYRDQLERQRREARSQWRGRAVGAVVSGPHAYVIVEEAPGRAPASQWDWGPTVVTLRTSESGWRVSSDLTTGNMLVHFHIEVEDERGDRVVLS